MQSLSEIIYFKNTPAFPLEIEWWLPNSMEMDPSKHKKIV